MKVLSVRLLDVTLIDDRQNRSWPHHEQHLCRHGREQHEVANAANLLATNESSKSDAIGCLHLASVDTAKPLVTETQDATKGGGREGV